MKKAIYIIVIAILLNACKSSSSQLESGNYDAALQKSAKKIRKKPGNFEEVDTFNDAYRLAYAKDNTEVERLKSDGNPANWNTIYSIYIRMRKRQDLAASLPPVGINYQERNFDEDINAAKSNATEYAYTQGLDLLATNDRYQARKAYEWFRQVKGYNPSYKEVSAKMTEAKQMGTTNVFYRVENVSGIATTQEMMGNLQNLNLNELDKKWKNYDSYIDTNKLYHYSIVLSLQLIEITPEQAKKTASIESKKVEDGFNYVLDASGNVTKDTLGNDVKIPKYKTITCKVQRFNQNKAVRLSGFIQYIDNATDRIIKKDPLISNASFQHKYAVATGDFNALKPETLKEIKIEAKPFPSDDVMLTQAGTILKTSTKNNILQNQSLIK